ncbi:3-hydroxyacyl-[acyl-carrier-protein] dehydratase FabZ [Andreprevotia sp. IGB-42]|uniref:3-hydroxyacyl-ACP dehydratase FabZ n=1 Tax=Andreprevotia sp. IGB-42 TaxID=2497473 RepID=UPI00157F5AA8|nr:3-hydroxyacyl-ACP dehydratase FabZ [Andreprevotia sp. IGB-42]KAF0814371.1 3-hydroxyacyl-[acyl-carrier-protein] dehydratase FabZ [Andreprevotia sp. IGB-42]
MSEQMDVMEIMKYLPHRYPFLLVDRVLALVPGKTITALKNVTMNEPFFQGHFPGYPVMPGVLILEALAQAAGVLSFKTVTEKPSEDTLYFFAGIDNARFKRQVVPGDQLTLQVEIVAHKRGIWKYKAQAFVGDELAAEADLMCAQREVKR